METTSTTPSATENSQILDAGTYEILRKRLNVQADGLQQRLQQLNEARKEVFGAMEARLIATERIATDHNCVPRDMVPLSNGLFLFGYNVHMGLKQEVALKDVFSIYEYRKEDHSFHPKELGGLSVEAFHKDFTELYKYYKDTVFSKFFVQGPHLYMVFQIGKTAKDIKAFKWLLQADGLTYVDNRSDHEIQYPRQHEFEWKRTSRDFHREGAHPHISIEDRVFVETVGGDLTIKVEDNTDTGEGIYAEEVELKEQTLDDADIYYADLGNLILLKIRPFQEKQWRYIVFNEKLKTAKRIDAIEDACVLLPDDQGIVFSNGYYLQTGDYKEFDSELTGLHFERRMHSPNGEDHLYVFYQPVLGEYVLLSYNVIAQEIEAPIVCHGFSFFRNGELAYFKTDNEPKKNHGIQVWQTPYCHPDFVQPTEHADSFLFKLGNKEIVRGMADGYALLNLCRKEDSYEGLYADIAKQAMSLTDNYYWTAKEEAFTLQASLEEIRTTATTAIEEFEKVERQRKEAAVKTNAFEEQATQLLRKVERHHYQHIDDFVQSLISLRTLRGEAISLKEVRYIDLALLEGYEKKLSEKTDLLSQKCVSFLLEEEALQPYRDKVITVQEATEQVDKVTEADATANEIANVGGELELMIEIVSNLKIEDATQTTRIIDDISDIYAQLNHVKARLKAKRKELLGTEAVAEFKAQMKLLGQSVVNYLDVADTPQKCEEYLTRIMVQLEEVEGKFTDFEEFLEELSAKREEVYSAFETRKTQLQEARNKRSAAMVAAAERILKGIGNKLKGFKEIAEINAHFAADMMVDKVRDLIEKLHEMEESNKAEDLQSQLKTLKEDAVRQLKDKQDLFVEGENVIKLGRHHFAINTQELDASIVQKGEDMFYHLTGTQFYEKIEDKPLLDTRSVWNQSLPSENQEVYRGEFLSYQMLTAMIGQQLPYTVQDFLEMETSEQLKSVQTFMAPRYQEGYNKGVHDQDALQILKVLLTIYQQIGLLRYGPASRACAYLFWEKFLSKEEKQLFKNRIEGAGLILQVFPDAQEYKELLFDLETGIATFLAETDLFETTVLKQAAEYLFHQLVTTDHFVSSKEAYTCYVDFYKYLKLKRVEKDFEGALKKLKQAKIVHQVDLLRGWVNAFMTTLDTYSREELSPYKEEIVTLLLSEKVEASNVQEVVVRETVKGLAGDHSVIQQGEYLLDYNAFIDRLMTYELRTLPQYHAYLQVKNELVTTFKKAVKLESFKPRVLSSFVRNKLINEVYLPLMGDNLAKQMGTVGENKRTDLMGLLLLLSPPGYGKTTLMEYVASRLGLIFMKINGPAIGHQVTSLDPSEAPNATAKEELEKLNLSFEMGDNVMIYLDDIQHCNPELLQKFISLCDGQRKIEGVYKGITRTYDFRGKKVCVVMAGNPYTETGEKFQIPDMLANRADTYNLGEIIGDSDEAFKLSYIENSITSNPTLSSLNTVSKEDLYNLIQVARTGSREGITFESNFSGDAVDEYVNVLKKMLKVQDVVLKVNQQYVRSAAQEDAYRTEPAFKLQGSYRNMNKLAEKVVPVMNEEELDTLLLSHYEGESQTLTTGAEANMLKFKEMMGWLTEGEAQRWESIKQQFCEQLKVNTLGDQAQTQELMQQIKALTIGLQGIQNAIENKK
ncbi:DNA repair ATPase [Algivirga pacifica]|uniref:DNA repair ATPase n=1 Tax=Algivirga pacifica TaxID=1162670 RepID=A0ABP9DAE7_9BACT